MLLFDAKKMKEKEIKYMSKQHSNTALCIQQKI